MQSNCYNWSTYPIPVPGGANKTEEEEVEETFSIRHLKQGGTGARKTWESAEVLLDYLVCRGGLRQLNEKVDSDERSSSSSSSNVLDLTGAPEELFDHHGIDPSKALNVIELGGGTGFLSIGLAMAMGDTGINLICTDNDKPTIKNMRHNISRQPKEAHLHKTVKIQHLDWGDDIGGEAFSKAMQLHFCDKKKQSTITSSETADEDDDPMNLVSHLIASDVLYGATTLEPLSSIIAALKLRNPKVVVVILCKERKPNFIAELQQLIESKLKSGLCDANQDELGDFAVSVRDVLHEDLPLMKMIEC